MHKTLWAHCVHCRKLRRWSDQTSSKSSSCQLSFASVYSCRSLRSGRGSSSHFRIFVFFGGGYSGSDLFHTDFASHNWTETAVLCGNFAITVANPIPSHFPVVTYLFPFLNYITFIPVPWDSHGKMESCIPIPDADLLNNVETEPITAIAQACG